MHLYQVPESWKRAVKGIINDPGVCIVLGGSDSGKTSFIKYLSKEAKCLFIDMDIGQSTIEPPACIGLSFIENGIIEAPPLKRYFVGSVSPTGYMLPFITGGRKILDYACGFDNPLIVVDTTGMVYGGGAKELKIRKIDILSPKHLIALQKKQELENILLPHEKRTGMNIWRIEAPDTVRTRTMQERQETEQGVFLLIFIKKAPFLFQ